MQDLNLTDFPLKTFDKIRYGDTDRQGHVNNAVFSTFLETGRVELLINADPPILSEGASFVIASLKLNFIREMKWPGQVDIGTGILKLGNSSMTIYQRLFQNGECVADAETVIVQVDNTSGRGKPLSDTAKETLGKWLLK
ncbi:MAG: acyl-CoA thioesterase [Bacteroidetes bacterium]|nr:MAG: acyl-CoA thioesterase [Bacteroidota bacterium]